MSAYASAVLADNPALYYRLGDAHAPAVNSGSLGSSYYGLLGANLTTGVAGCLVGDPDTAVFFPSGNAGSSYGGYSLIPNGNPDALKFGTNFSYEFWTNATTVGGNWVSWAYGASVFSSVGFSGAYLFVSGTATVVSASPLPLNTNVHVVSTYDGATVVLYINGVRTGSAAASSNQYYGGSSLYIGAVPYTVNSVNATIDEFAIYPTALSAARVQAHYLAGTVLVRNASGNTDNPGGAIGNGQFPGGATGNGIFGGP